MQVWNVLHAACWKCRTKVGKNCASGHHCTTLLGYIFATKACIDNSKKKLVKQQCLPTCPHNMVNFGLLAAEICWWVWGTPGNFNGFRILAALLHGTLVVTISQTLRRWTHGAIYIWQGGHQVEHWPTFLVLCCVLTKYCSITWCDLFSNYCNSFSIGHNFNELEMWANAQRDGRPAEHRWRPLFNAAKFGWCWLLDCRAVMLPRRGSRFK